MEDLYHNINSEPIVKEKPDAKDFEYKEGKVKFENLSFKHYNFDETELRRKAKPSANDAKQSGKEEEAKTEAEKKIHLEEKMLLTDFSLEIEPGTTNAIVG